jgi:hypothetical protein
MGTPMAGGRPQQYPLNNSNNCGPIFMKLGENVYGHNISAKFDNQPNRFSHFRVMALYLQNWQTLRPAYFMALWHRHAKIDILLIQTNILGSHVYLLLSSLFLYISP